MAAGKTAILAIRIVTDATKAAKELQGLGNESATLEKKFAKANKAASAVVGGIALVGAAAYKQASDLQQASGAVESVYGKQAKAVNDLAKTSADRLGLARSEYKDTAAVFGAQLKNMGTSSKELVPLTDRLIGLGSDLAATFGGTTTDAVAALSSLMRGERDPIEKYGVSLKQADINARLAAKGQSALTGEAKKAAETQATLDLLFQQTASAQGQYARESDTAAGAESRRNAQMKDTAATLGTVLLPIVAAFNTALAGMAGFAESNSTTFLALTAVILGVAAAVIAINAGYKIYRAYVIAAAAAQVVMNSALLASPITWLVGIIALLVAAFVLAYQKSDAFRSIVDAAGRAGKNAIGWVVDKASALWYEIQDLGSVVSWMKDLAVGAFNGITKPIRSVIDMVRNLIDWIQSIRWPSPPSWVKSMGNGFGLFGSYTLAAQGGGAASAYVPSVFAAPGELKAAAPGRAVLPVGGRGTSGGVVVNVYGALDPVAVGNQIAELLGRRNVRMGRPV